MAKNEIWLSLTKLWTSFTRKSDYPIEVNLRLIQRHFNSSQSEWSIAKIICKNWMRYHKNKNFHKLLTPVKRQTILESLLCFERSQVTKLQHKYQGQRNLETRLNRQILSLIEAMLFLPNQSPNKKLKAFQRCSAYSISSLRRVRNTQFVSWQNKNSKCLRGYLAFGDHNF